VNEPRGFLRRQLLGIDVPELFVHRSRDLASECLLIKPKSMRLMAGMEVRPSQMFAEFIERTDFVGVEIQQTAERMRAVYKPRHKNRRHN
jgi:hypothetical protein